MNDNNRGTISIKNAKIRFRNFAGKELRFNVEGKRNFCVLLDPVLAKDLEADGWNVKYLRPRDVDDEPTPYIQVAVSYEYFPPKVYLVTKKSKNLINESEIDILDWSELSKVDLTIRPYRWEVNGKTGIKAYLKTMYATLEEDDIDEDYEDIPYKGDSEELPFD